MKSEVYRLSSSKVTAKEFNEILKEYSERHLAPLEELKIIRQSECDTGFVCNIVVRALIYNIDIILNDITYDRQISYERVDYDD